MISRNALRLEYEELNVLARQIDPRRGGFGSASHDEQTEADPSLGTWPRARSCPLPRTPESRPIVVVFSRRNVTGLGRVHTLDPDMGCLHRAREDPPCGSSAVDLEPGCSPVNGTIYAGGITVRYAVRGRIRAEISASSPGWNSQPARWPSPDGKTLLAGKYRGVGLWNVADRREIRRLSHHDIGNWCYVLIRRMARRWPRKGGRDVATGKVMLTLLGPIPGPETNPLNIGFPKVVNPRSVLDPSPSPNRGSSTILPSPIPPMETDHHGAKNESRSGTSRPVDRCAGPSGRTHPISRVRSTAGLLGRPPARGTRGEVGGLSDPSKIDRTIHIWDLASGQEIVTLANDPGRPSMRRLLPAGPFLASGSRSNDSDAAGRSASGRSPPARAAPIRGHPVRSIPSPSRPTGVRSSPGPTPPRPWSGTSTIATLKELS